MTTVSFQDLYYRRHIHLIRQLSSEKMLMDHLEEAMLSVNAQKSSLFLPEAFECAMQHFYRCFSSKPR